MNADWDPNAIVTARGSQSPPINIVHKVASATDYPLGIQTNENSFADNALFHDQDDFFSGLPEIYDQFYQNMVPPPANTISNTVPLMSQTIPPSEFDPIDVHLPLPQFSNSMQQVQGDAMLHNTVQVQGDPCVQAFVASSSSIQPVRHKKRKNQNDKTIIEMTPEELAADSGAWRKYGQKPIKGSPHPRHYYRCSAGKGCGARKQVERSLIDPETFVVAYYGEHSHPRATRRGSFAGNTRIRLVSEGDQDNNNNNMDLLFTGLQDSEQSSGVPMSPWTPISTAAFDNEDDDWGVSKSK